MAKGGLRSGRQPRAASPARTARERRRRVVPDPATVVEEHIFVSPKGRRYRILRTTQMDPYDKPPRRPKK
jgi:hypothetical protein